MRKWFTALAACAALAMTNTALAQGDAAAGKQKSAVCAACHGADGNSSNPQWPSLAELGAPYIVRQLEHFKNGERKDPLMSPQAAGLSEQDMKDLAAYYESQTMKPGGADPSLVELGEKIWHGGIMARNVPACAACHGPVGDGNPAAAYPRLGGQQAVYLEKALTDFHSGARTTDPAGMMREIAGKMTADEIRAVASYASGLYRR
jgi:cytochrome c553